MPLVGLAHTVKDFEQIAADINEMSGVWLTAGNPGRWTRQTRTFHFPNKRLASLSMSETEVCIFNCHFEFIFCHRLLWREHWLKLLFHTEESTFRESLLTVRSQTTKQKIPDYLQPPVAWSNNCFHGRDSPGIIRSTIRPIIVHCVVKKNRFHWLYSCCHHAHHCSVWQILLSTLK